MADFLLRCKRFRIVQGALWMMLPGFVQANLPEAIPAFSENELVAAAGKNAKAPPDTYRINFTNVSIIEYIRFVSKISGANFAFEEADLDFNVTIVSEEPATVDNVFSALIQVLRSNNLNLLEQNGNYVITKNTGVMQIPDIINSEEEELPKASLSTRVFRIANSKADSVAAIIRGLVSQKAQVAVFTETNQIIVTDITTNIDKIASLLAILDAPQSQLEIENYLAKHAPVKELIALAQQILTPFNEGNPLIYVPQLETNSIFIISTPHLIDRSMAILEDLDIPARMEDLNLPTSTENIFLYKVLHRPKDEILSAIKTLSSQFEAMPNPPTKMVAMLRTARYVPDSNSLVFIGDATSFTKVQEILGNIDAPNAGEQILIYQLRSDNAKQIENSLNELLSNLKKSPSPDVLLMEAIKSLTYSPDSNSFIFTGDADTLAHLKQIVTTFDQAGATSRMALYVFQPKTASEGQIKISLDQLAKTLASSPVPDAALITVVKGAKYMPETRSFVFSGSQETLNRLEPLLTSLDAAAANSFYIYTLTTASEAQFRQSLKNLISSLEESAVPDASLIETLKSASYLPGSHSFTFTGTPDAINRLTQILPTLDAATGSSTYFVHRIQNTTYDALRQSVLSFIGNLETSANPDQALINSLKSMRYVKESNSIVFTGDKASLDRVQKVMSEFDVPGGGAGAYQANRFYVYSPKNKKVSEMMSAIKDMTDHLRASGLTDPSLIRTLETAKPTSNAVVFTGDDASIQSLQTLLPTIDSQAGAEQQLFLYRPVNLNHFQLEQSLKSLAQKLSDTNVSDKKLKEAISSMQWEDASQSVAFNGSSATIDRLKILIASIDVPPEGGFKHQAYTVYQLKYTTPDNVMAYLEKIAENLGTPSAHAGVAEVIKNIKAPDANSLLLTGEASAVDKVTKLIEQYDTPAAAQFARNVFIYKPKFIDAKDLQSALMALITDLAPVDPQLMKTVQNAKYVEANQSVAFSGNPVILDQLKALIAELDIPSAAKVGLQRIGEKTFFIYKLQFVTASQLASSLKSISEDLAKGGVEDKELAQTINSMKSIKETNSVLFTGPESTLTKVQQLLPKFDIPSLAAPKPFVAETVSNFMTYHPQYKSGDELIELLCDFDNNLRLSGVSSPGLSSAISNMRWMENTCTLIISGDQESMAKVEQLLRQFDVPSPQQALIGEAMQLGETSFLIYKLQYHQGDDIRMALRKVASDLQDTHKGEKMPVADAIDALQWIPVTNSLLTSGPPDILAKVRELIQNLDVPLRQVFIEVLILTTEVGNAQNLGLSWSGRGQYKNKASGQLANFQAPPFTSTTFTDPLLNSNFANLNATTTPSVNSFATPGGFDLGVIGDIIFNKGKSFVTLGSFIDALESDSDTTIVTNPKLIAQDSNTATVFYGQNIPFTGSLVTNSANSITTSASLEYRNVGNNISITPTLGSGDLITLDISINLSSTVGTVAGATPSNQVQGIITNQQSLATRVHVPSGWFVCLTGQLEDAKVHLRNQIPCLGGLPLIGLAFSGTQRNDARTNVVIFIKPEIIKTFEDYKRISQNQEELLKDVSSLPVVKEQIDEGIGWVKTPENE